MIWGCSRGGGGSATKGEAVWAAAAKGRWWRSMVAVARMAEASAATAGTAAAVAGQGPRGGARVDWLLSFRMLL